MGTQVIDIVMGWKRFGLSNLQAEVDDSAAAIAARQDESEESRRALVELTRDFRRTTPEDVRKQIAPLLKSFQSEVDRLSNRSKAAETAFLNVYKKLIDMPDVTPALEYTQIAQQKLVKLADLQVENAQLKETVSNLSSELSDVASQEVTIKQLKEEIRQYEAQRDTTIEERMKELERDLLREFQEREQTYHDQQLLQTRRLTEAEHKVAQLTSELDLSQTELFEVKAKFDENSHARSDELDMVLVDLERANQRAALAEREVVSLKEQLALSVKRAQLADEGDVGSDSRRSATERQLASKDNEISQLVEDVQRLQTQLTELENQSVCQRARLEEELEQKNSVIQKLEAIIDQQKDYEELKKEFSILKSIEFPGSSQPSASDETTASAAKPLELLMLEKSKAMQNENTALKVKTADLQGAPLPHPLGFGESALGGGTAYLPTAPGFGCAPFATASGALASLASQSAALAPPPASFYQPAAPVTSAERVHTCLIGSGDDPWARAGGATPSPPQREDAEPEEGRCSPVAESPSSGGAAADPAAALAAAAAAAYRFDEPDRGDRLIPKGDPMETRLQEMLRFNMDKYSNQSLDTLQLARRVRELLSINNIGQRMFARFILGLSQGTVSELLSKPKPWEKLTEKGRDSYRKMHAWAVDDAAVCLLKAVIPKKAKDSRPSLASGGRSEETPVAADERIAHILTEASQAMKSEPSTPADERPPADAASPSAQSPESRDPLQRLRRLGSCPLPAAEDSANTQEKIARLYQEHLAKMMGHRPELSPAYSMDHYQRLRTPEELRSAMDFYNQELVKHMQQLQHQQQQQQQQLPPSVATPTSSGGGLDGPPARPSDPGSDGAEETAGSTFTLVRPPSGDGQKAVAASSPGPLTGVHPASLFMPAATSAAEEAVTSASPLQRMASITNSLINSAALPPLGAHPPRPMKAVLPPITQQQFDQFSNLNTEEIVRRIKEHLSQFSISQRLFGESVLGLSQGSVSDLLARPKPWHMLTQKGREPFIRMKMFLDDESAVHKLVASQYKIAPEKLMRTGCYNGGFPKMPLKLPDMSKPLEAPLPAAASLAQFPVLPPVSLASRLSGMDPLIKFGLRLPPGQMAMSVYETAAITPELDTMYITTKIKEVLLANNIGQKLFGEVVLGLSQGSVSELLSKPKPWHLLSIKGREPFIRMKMWLEDTPRNLERLQSIKNDRKESNKRRRSQLDAASESNDSSDVYSSMSNSPNAKKSRVLFSDEQKEALKLAFALDPYPNMTSIEFLCQELNLTHRTITNWFHNHRMRLKQSAAGGEAPYLPGASRDGQPLDPIQFRLLLNRRLQELQREKGGGPLPGPLPFPGMPAPLPFPYSMDARLAEPMSGLDLSMKSDNDFDQQSDEASNLSEDAGSPPPAGSPRDEEEEEAAEKAATPAAARTSRRKPAAPQWVNPQWAAETRRPPQQLINGVCVVQTGLEASTDAAETAEEPAAAAAAAADAEADAVDAGAVPGSPPAADGDAAAAASSEPEGGNDGQAEAAERREGQPDGLEAE